MKKYKLKKVYPNSPALGFIAEQHGGSNFFQIGSSYSYPESFFKEFNEFWEEIVEVKKDYEILAYTYNKMNIRNIITKRSNSKFLNSLNSMDNYGLFDESLYVNSPLHSIYSVKRLSDGEI